MSTASSGETNNHIKSDLMKRLKFFHVIARDISKKKPLNILLDEIILASKKLLLSEASSLLIYKKEEEKLVFHTVYGQKSSGIKTESLPLGSGIAGWVAQKKKPCIIKDCYADPRFNSSFDSQTGFKTRNMICVPMQTDNKLIGVLQVMNKRQNEDYTKDDLELLEALAAQCAVVIENARLDEIELKSQQMKFELDTARQIQQNIIQSALPQFDDLDLFIKLIPAREVGGDYYKVRKINDSETLIFIADASGKSISAALIVSAVYSYLEFYISVYKENFDIVSFADSMNRFLIVSTTQDKFVTGWIGLFNHKTKRLKSVNAGHNPPYLLRAGTEKFVELSEGGLMFGSLPFPYSSDEIKLEKGDLIVFYTDGVTEAKNSNDDDFGEQELQNIISLSRHSPSPLIVVRVLEGIKYFVGSAEQSDDITLGILRLK